jgi:hypothetical protein
MIRMIGVMSGCATDKAMPNAATLTIESKCYCVSVIFEAPDNQQSTKIPHDVFLPLPFKNQDLFISPSRPYSQTSSNRTQNVLNPCW